MIAELWGMPAMPLPEDSPLRGEGTEGEGCTVRFGFVHGRPAATIERNGDPVDVLRARTFNEAYVNVAQNYPLASWTNPYDEEE
jgi:hypothetical protein